MKDFQPIISEMKSSHKYDTTSHNKLRWDDLKNAVRSLFEALNVFLSDFGHLHHNVVVEFY